MFHAPCDQQGCLYDPCSSEAPPVMSVRLRARAQEGLLVIAKGVVAGAVHKVRVGAVHKVRVGAVHKVRVGAVHKAVGNNLTACPGRSCAC